MLIMHNENFLHLDKILHNFFITWFLLHYAYIVNCIKKNIEWHIKNRIPIEKIKKWCEKKLELEVKKSKKSFFLSIDRSIYCVCMYVDLRWILLTDSSVENKRRKKGGNSDIAVIAAIHHQRKSVVVIIKISFFSYIR